MQTRGWPDGDDFVSKAINNGIARSLFSFHGTSVDSIDEVYKSLLEDTAKARRKIAKRASCMPAPKGSSSKKKRAHNHKSLRVLLWQRDSVDGAAQCHWCMNWLTVKNYTMDHVIDLADNGPHMLSNLVIACSECNGRRGRESDARRRAGRALF